MATHVRLLKQVHADSTGTKRTSGQLVSDQFCHSTYSTSAVKCEVLLVLRMLSYRQFLSFEYNFCLIIIYIYNQKYEHCYIIIMQFSILLSPIISKTIPRLKDEQLEYLLLIISIYFCDSRFLKHQMTKTRYRNNVYAKADLRWQLSSISP